MGDYLPRPDAEFLAWSQSFAAYLTANTADLGLTPLDVAPINAGVSAFGTALGTQATAVQAASAAKEAKHQARSTIEEAIRSLVRRIQVNPATTDAQRAGLGITVPDRNPSMVQALGLESRPVGMVDTGQRLRHEIAFVDEASPTRRAKPAGVMGCEIWVTVKAAGEAPPADPGQYQFLGLDTASPYVAEYEGTEAGKTAHYLLRWVRTNGEKGPWSETVSATVAG